MLDLQPMPWDWKFLIPFGISIVALWLQYRQTQLATVALRKQKPGKNTPSPPYWTQRWPLLVMMVLTVLVWIPYFLSQEVPARTNVIKTWGVVEDDVCSVVLDAAELESYIPGYSIAMVCGIADNDIDIMKDTAISFSPTYTLVGVHNLELRARPSERMRSKAKSIAEVVAQRKGTPLTPKSSLACTVWFVAFLVPKNFDITRLNTLNDIESNGGILIEQFVRQGASLSVGS
jgi:hypothetical protein